MSKRFALNVEDVKKVLKNALIFAAPALIVLVASFKDIVPQDANWAIIALWGLNTLTDLLRKFVAGK